MAEPDVFDGAMRIARVEYPALDADRTRAAIDELARRAAEKVEGQGRRAVLRLNAFFFDELGFHGNADDYYDPRNSYLNDVIDRRTGIPITLSTVYCEIARRVGLPAYGVGFPGHFLVKCPTGRSEILLDCFSGRVLTRDDCRELLDSMQTGAALSEEMFAIASPRDILSRMLNNLRRIHEERGDLARTIRWVELDMELRPGDPDNYRERGILLAQTEDFGKALADFERYARLAPDAPDLPKVREQIKLLGKLLSHLN
ncbi:MAG TPA: tetratricopeptide repeat protein [Planctomycetota bacterium]|nr:tetratricopeptide repeat protein [Planctomycetota bacterium]